MKRRDSKKNYNEIVENIAKDFLGIDSLEVRNSDSLDFHELSVWSVKEALIQAVKEGEKAKEKSR